MSKKRLYRSKDDRVVAGVCGGIAEYFDVDPALIRIAALIMVFSGGGFLAYLVAWLVIPENPAQKGESPRIEKIVKEKTDKKQDEDGARMLGVIFVLLGLYFLINNFVDWMSFKYVWPFFIISIGILMLRRKG